MHLASKRSIGCPAARLVLSAREEIRGAVCRLTVLTLASWRSRVWDDLLAMLGAADPAGAARVEARMGLRAGLFARLLGLPLPAL